MTAQPSASPQLYPLWISGSLFIPVDRDGYCARSSEGALGCVVQVLEYGAPNAKWALKIPRLLADTARENAYINKLMNDEYDTVKRVIGEGGERNGLLDAQIAGDQSFLRFPTRSRDSSNPEARASDNQLILVRFEKGKGPRFCGVRLGTDALRVTPSNQLANQVAQYLSPEDLDLLLGSDDRNRSGTRVLPMKHQYGSRKSSSSSPDADTLPGFELGDTLREKHGVDCWYVFLPSVLYRWANISLHQALEDGVKWSVGEHLQLANQILDGLFALHHRRVIHADLRPANIMCEGNFHEPRNYRIIDYGSFGVERASNRLDIASVRPAMLNLRADDSERINRAQAVLGPSALPQRASPFYAPERRPGGEDESADVAVIVSLETPGPQAKVFVVYGWKSRLLDHNGQAHQSVVSAIRSHASKLSGKESGSTQSDNDSHLPREHQDGTTTIALPERTLQAFDRIRLRDFVLDIQDVSTITFREPGENKDVSIPLLACSWPYWRVFHDRVVVCDSAEYLAQNPEENELPGPVDILAVPRVIELHQVSAPTDVYGLGAILLYSLFRQSYNREQGERWGGADRLFSMMLSTIETSRYFENVGSQIEICRRDIFKHIRSGTAPAGWWNQPTSAKTHTSSIKSYVSNVVDAVIAVTPGMEFAHVSCGKNNAEMVLLLHFILCCIHRRSVLTNEQGVSIFESDPELMKRQKEEIEKRIENGEKRDSLLEAIKKDANYIPFCKSRSESVSDMAILRAAARLRELQYVLGRDVLAPFVAPNVGSSSGIYRTELEVRSQLFRAETGIKEAKELCQTVKKTSGFFSPHVRAATLDKAINVLAELSP